MINAQRFAKDWEAGWNSHCLPRILAHYAEDITFHSRKAFALTGKGTLHGKAALEAYWRAALNAQPDLHFSITDVFEGHNMLVITYRNHKNIDAAETLHFGPHGLVTEASACHKPS